MAKPKNNKNNNKNKNDNNKIKNDAAALAKDAKAALEVWEEAETAVAKAVATVV